MKTSKRKNLLIYFNLAAFVLGCLAGLALYKFGMTDKASLEKIIEIMTPFGNVLVHMLKMIVIPIIFFSLICGAASMPAKSFGKMGAGVCGWYFFTSLYAAIFGSIIAILLNPSLQSAEQLAADNLSKAQTMQMSSTGAGNAVVKLVYSLFTNPFEALAAGNFLAVIVFAIMFGLAARIVLDTTEDSKVKNALETMIAVFEGCQAAIFKMIEWIMKYFPIGIFALTACCFAKFGVALFISYLQVAGCVIIGILLMLLICYPAMIALICRVNPYPVLWKLREPIFTAFATRSSAATLPVSMRTAEEKLHVKKELSNFTLSLGATVNMDGVCVHLPVFAVLAANMFGFELTLGQIFLLVLSVVFASVGAGGIPGGSIFLLFLVLDALKLDPVQTSTIVALALGINPLLDMFETACNVAGDNIGTFVVGKKLKMIDETSTED